MKLTLNCLCSPPKELEISEGVEVKCLDCGVTFIGLELHTARPQLRIISGDARG